MTFRRIEMTSVFCEQCDLAGVRRSASFDVLGRAKADNWVESDDREITGRMIDGKFYPASFRAWLFELSESDGGHLFQQKEASTIH